MHVHAVTPTGEPALSSHRVGSADQTQAVTPSPAEPAFLTLQWSLLLLLSVLHFRVMNITSSFLLRVHLSFETESLYGPCCPGYYVDLAVLELIFFCLFLLSTELKVCATMPSLSKSYIVLTIKSLRYFELIFM